MKLALILGPPLVFPLLVFQLARKPTESPFGNALEMLAVMNVAAVVAVVYVGVAVWRKRTRRERALPWLLAAGIATSPWAYFFLWNVFFR